MLRRHSVIIKIAIGLVVAAWGCENFNTEEKIPPPSQKAPEPPLVKVAPVKRCDICVPIFSTGTLYPQHESKIGPRISGTIQSVYVDEGDRVDEGKILAQHGVRAAMDLSDGLIADLNKVCQASKVGARVWTNKVPIHPLVQAAFPADATGLALSGGEDYELLFTAPHKKRVKAIHIGEIIKRGRFIIDRSGRKKPFSPKGYQHFS